MTTSASPGIQDDRNLVQADLYENSPDCIKILSLDGTIKRLSPGGEVALELDRPDQLNGQRWPSLWPGSEQARVEQALVDAREGKRTHFLAFCPTVKQTPRWWDVVVSPMAGAEGVLAVSRDVTELVNAREALLKVDERKNQFLTVLSHELRNPLSTLGMAVKLLQSSGVESERLERVAQTMERQIAHMSRLAEDLLDISRITRGEIRLHVTEFDLAGAVGDAAEQLGAMTSSKGQALRLRLPDDPVLLHGDRTRVVQVLGNLLANASRYSPSGSPIDVTLEARADTASIVVADQGLGISEELRPRIFDTYAQGHGPGNSRTSGVGMGLAIVKGIVDLHGGTIEVQSAGPGQGSAFTVSLPMRGATPFAG